jgi:hypothetical protein
MPPVSVSTATASNAELHHSRQLHETLSFSVCPQQYGLPVSLSDRHEAVSAQGCLAAQQAAQLRRPAKTLLAVRLFWATACMPIALRLRDAGRSRLRQQRQRVMSQSERKGGMHCQWPACKPLPQHPPCQLSDTASTPGDRDALLLLMKLLILTILQRDTPGRHPGKRA